MGGGQEAAGREKGDGGAEGDRIKADLFWKALCKNPQTAYIYCVTTNSLKLLQHCTSCAHTAPQMLESSLFLGPLTSHQVSARLDPACLSHRVPSSNSSLTPSPLLPSYWLCLLESSFPLRPSWATPGCQVGALGSPTRCPDQLLHHPQPWLPLSLVCALSRVSFDKTPLWAWPRAAEGSPITPCLVHKPENQTDPLLPQGALHLWVRVCILACVSACVCWDSIAAMKGERVHLSGHLEAEQREGQGKCECREEAGWAPGGVEPPPRGSSSWSLVASMQVLTQTVWNCLICQVTSTRITRAGPCLSVSSVPL